MAGLTGWRVPKTDGSVEKSFPLVFGMGWVTPFRTGEELVQMPSAEKSHSRKFQLTDCSYATCTLLASEAKAFARSVSTRKSPSSASTWDLGDSVLRTFLSRVAGDIAHGKEDREEPINGT